MRKGHTASNSSDSKENQQPWLKDFKEQSSPHGCSPDEDSLADSAMKRSQRFSSSLSFGENSQLQSGNEDGKEQLSPKNSNGLSIPVLAETETTAECTRLENWQLATDNLCDTNVSQSLGLLRPQELWLAMTRCLSVRWPPCLSINRQSSRKLSPQVEYDGSEETQLSPKSESTNESSLSTLTSDDRAVMLVKHEEEQVRSKGVKSALPSRYGVSRSSPRLPTAREATDSLLASMILEKETFLRIELVDSGEERDDLRYRAEWKLSERTKELAEGVWLSRSQKK